MLFQTHVNDNLSEEFKEFILNGGFPKSLEFPDVDSKQVYTRGIISEIFDKDIRKRKRISNVAVFERVQSFILNNYSKTFSFANLTGCLRKEGFVFKDSTVRGYIEDKEAILLALKFTSENNISCKSVINGYTNFVFINPEGRVFSYKKLNSRLERICRGIRKSGHSDFPHISTHMLRHTFATRMNEAGIDAKATSSILGHKEVSITINTYIDATEEFKAAQMQVLEDYFKKTDSE